MAKWLLMIVWSAAVIATLVLAMLPIARTSLLTYDLSRFGFAILVFGWLIYAIARSWRLSRYEHQQPSLARKKIHSVPRRFGMGTLLVVSLAFGGLSMLLRWLQPPAVAVFLILLYVMLIGLLQFLLHGAPRQASMIAGACFFLVFCNGSELLLNPNLFAIRGSSDIAFRAAAWSVGGAFSGYLTGVLIGTVFMAISGAKAVWANPRI